MCLVGVAVDWAEGEEGAEGEGEEEEGEGLQGKDAVVVVVSLAALSLTRVGGMVYQQTHTRPPEASR